MRINTKKIILFVKVILLFVLVALIISVLSSIFKKRQLKERRLLLLEQKEQEALEALEGISSVPLSPKAILDRESKIMGEEIRPQEPLAPSELPKKPVRRPTKKIIKTKDTADLFKLFNEALEKNDEPLLAQVIKTLEFKEQDVVSLLREQILNNFTNLQIRRLAVLGLFYTDNKPEATLVLKTVLKIDPDENVRLAGLFVLDSLLGKEALVFLEEIGQQDPSEKVRLEAKRYIFTRNINQ